MIVRNILKEDLQLKHFAEQPTEHNPPRFDWSEYARAQTPALPGQLQIKIEIGGQTRDYDIAEVADTVGGALTDLLISRQEEDIFNDENQRLVAGIARSVTEEIVEQSEQSRASEMTFDSTEMSRIIERALIKNNAHDVARSLIIRSQRNAAGANGEDGVQQRDTNVIRRNGQAVRWNPNKVEIAVRKAFLSLHLDSGPAEDVTQAINDRIAEDGAEFIHIEDLQDRVQEELMRQGYFKVAEAYILYRAHRAVLREAEQQESLEVEAKAEEDPNQDALILVRNLDGSTFLWDGTDLRKRIEFASLKLDLCLDGEEIERELRAEQ